MSVNSDGEPTELETFPKTTVSITNVVRQDHPAVRRPVVRTTATERARSPPSGRASGFAPASGSQPTPSTSVQETRPVRPAYAEDVYGAPEEAKPPPKLRRPDLDLSGVGINRQSAAQKRDEILEDSASPEEVKQMIRMMINRRDPDMPVSSASTEMSGSALAQRRSAHLPKLKEFPTEPLFEPAEPQSRSNTGDLDFEYTDCDTHANELAELYTYSEIDDFALNVQCFRDYIDAKQLDRQWCGLSKNQQNGVLFDLIQRLESAIKNVRLRAARCILYLLQGAFLDFVDEKVLEIEDGVEKGVEPEKVLRNEGCEESCLSQGILNAYQAYKAGVFQALCSALAIEINEPFESPGMSEQPMSRSSSVSNSRSTSNIDLSESAEKRTRRSATLSDNEILRVVLSALYHMVEAIRREDVFRVVIPFDKQEYYTTLRNDFTTELNEPVDGTKMPLIMILLDMMPAFCHGNSPHFPMRKVLLLIWKILLAVLGGWKELRELKAAKRKAAGLSEIEDTVLIGDSLKACNLNGNELEQNPRGSYRPKRATHPSARLLGRQLACVSTDETGKGAEDEADEEQVPIEVDDSPGSSSTSSDEGFRELIDMKEIADEEDSSAFGTIKPARQDDNAGPGSVKLRRRSSKQNPLATSASSGDRTPVAESPPPILNDSDFRKIPFRSKVREEDIEMFLQHMRMKFFNYRLPKDSTTVFGLPEATQLNVDVMRRNLYVSLGDVQIQREKVLNRYLFSQRETDIELTNAEQLYRLMLPNLSQYVIALLKVLLAAAPSSKPKNEAINILSDVLTVETESSEVLSNSMNFDSSLSNVLEQSVRIAIDVNRHKEVLVKAASSVLILLIKHFRQNHVFQFEYLCQHLVFANCIPLILKFLDQNLVRYIQSKHELLPFNYPAAPLYYVQNNEEWPPLSDENVEACDSQSQTYYLWRNVFSTINLLRVLNKLTKWKHARTMMLVVFKSAPILKRALRIRLGIFQLYVLKLLKMQARYLGRQWRRSNMELMSSIFSRVRHRINDDWAFANETRSKSWDFQNEEAALKAAVERFNSRRYAHLYPALALEPNEAPSPGEKYLDTIDLRDFEPVDNSFQSVLGIRREMSDRFKRNYKKWLDEEVFRRNINWDQVLYHNRGIIDLV